MFKKDFERTPQEKARRAQFSILARLGGCGYLVYIIVQLLRDPKSSPSTWATVFAYILLAAAVVVIGITIYDLIHGLKHGRFNAATYDDGEALYPCGEDTAESPDEDSETPETGNALEEHSPDGETAEDDSDKPTGE
jgi:hypothetical protein